MMLLLKPPRPSRRLGDSMFPLKVTWQGRQPWTQTRRPTPTRLLSERACGAQGRHSPSVLTTAYVHCVMELAYVV